MKKLAIAAVSVLALAACAGPAADSSADSTLSTSQTSSPSASPTPSPTVAAGFTVTSADFENGGELGGWSMASAFDGQCDGDNQNPALEWSNAPEGTESYAIIMLDRSFSNWIHWVHFDIPADVTSLERGGSNDLAGLGGANFDDSPDYFGPCPPSGQNRYEFTVYALDAMLGLEENSRLADVKAGIDEHLLAQASISGMRGPAE